MRTVFAIPSGAGKTSLLTRLAMIGVLGIDTDMIRKTEPRIQTLHEHRRRLYASANDIPVSAYDEENQFYRASLSRLCTYPAINVICVHLPEQLPQHLQDTCVVLTLPLTLAVAAVGQRSFASDDERLAALASCRRNHSDLMAYVQSHRLITHVGFTSHAQLCAYAVALVQRNLELTGEPSHV